MKTFQSIKYWIFDLDNTLYSGKTKVFEQVEKKMSKYVSDKLNVNIDEAKKIQKNYFHEYNTTLNGMIKNHKIDANEFLEFVHDIDIDFLKKDLKLSDELKRLDVKTTGMRVGIAALCAKALTSSPRLGTITAVGRPTSLKQLLVPTADFPAAPELYCFGLLQAFDVRELEYLAP